MFAQPRVGLINALSMATTPQWTWIKKQWDEFIRGFSKNQAGGWTHTDPTALALLPATETVIVKAQTPGILMTKAVYDGFRAAHSGAERSWFRQVSAKVPGYAGPIYGGEPILPSFRS
jgi:hypothetical protein